ncbi:MAG: hypothetical protein A2Z65_12975 [Gallionellales bacterium RIFCSPLOWO2_02_58_13]|nr:MAG: hypothetical protein A2Z65_12975 [Gallionellales bacterium RIFCSPLOWO2_02_58_13]
MMIMEVALPNDQAWAFAEFLKRAGYNDYRQLATSDDEAYAMQDAAEKVRAALAEKGIAPR